MVSYLTIQGHLLGEETSTRAREAESQTTKPMGIERERDTFFFFISLFSNCLCLVLFWQTPLTLANSLFCSLPCLSYVVSECQPSFAPPRELQASVTLSYMQHVKARHQASGHRSAQNQVKCQRLYPTLLVIVTFGEQKLVIWKGRKNCTISVVTSCPPATLFLCNLRTSHREGKGKYISLEVTLHIIPCLSLWYIKKWLVGTTEQKHLSHLASFLCINMDL